MAQSGCDALGVDWSTDLARARDRVGEHVALQGNLDPAVLLAPPAVARKEARRVLDAYGKHAGHIFNLGHGITPAASIDTVQAVVDEVRTYSTNLHAAGRQNA
jgi:uroporphyrinogen decarboxylase